MNYYTRARLNTNHSESDTRHPPFAWRRVRNNVRCRASVSSAKVPSSGELEVSFNHTKAAEESNGENVLANWNNPKLAEVYLKDWKRHWEHSEAVAARY